MKYLPLFILWITIEQAVAQSPLFIQRKAPETGIQFVNRIVEKPGSNVLEYEYFYNGGGVAAGDLNNDGLDDLVFTANEGPVKVYLNLGNWKFKDITEPCGLGQVPGWKTGVTLADVNGDGWLDIYISRSGNTTEELRKNLLYMNSQHETFEEQAKKWGLDDAGCSTQAAFFDFDLDGDLDVYVLNHPIRRFSNFDVGYMKTARDSIAGDRLYRNDGSAFKPVTLDAGISGNPISFGLGIAVLDFNADGWPDIYVSNDYDEDDYLYINQKNGTFQDEIKSILGHTSKFSMGNDAGDINNDGYSDFLTLDMLPEGNKRQKLLKGPDGYDHFQMLLSHGYYHQYMRNMLHLNNQDGTYSEIGQLAGISNTDWSWSPLFADFDLDGWQDLFISNGYMRDYTNLDFLNYTAPALIKKAREAGQAPDLFALVQQMPSSGVSSYLFRNTHDLRFENVTREWGMGQPSLSHGATYADLDNDGDLDLIINNTNQPAFLWENTAAGNRNHFIRIVLKGKEKNQFGIGAKILVQTADGATRIYENYVSRGFQSAVSTVPSFGIGLHQEAVVTVIWPGGAAQQVNVPANQTITLIQSQATDLVNPTHKIEGNLLTTTTTGIDFIHFEDDFNDFKREPLLPHQLSVEGPAACTGDVNGDGKLDVFIGGAVGQVAAVYLNNGMDSFREKYQKSLALHAKFEDVAAAFIDTDSDGDLDLYVVSGGNHQENGSKYYQDRIYLNDGTGNFSYDSTLIPTTESCGGTIAAYDYDADGDLDIFRGGYVFSGKYPYAPRSYILQNQGDGHFIDQTPEILAHPGMVKTAQWADINSNGLPDLVLTGEWMPIRIIEYAAGSWKEITDLTGLKETNGWWQQIVVADINRDGRMDIIAGNYGENNQFKASKTEPLTIDATDIEPNGSTDAILCYYLNGSAVPLASRDELFDQAPSLKSKFTSYAAYSDAKLADILPSNGKTAILHLEAYQLASGVFYGTNEGFKFHPFPAIVQESPLRGILLSELNKDDKMDLLLCGNHYGARAQTGRLDAGHGLVLEQFGPYTWQNRPNTGFSVLADSRQILQLGTDILIVVNSNGPVTGFKIIP